jgi:DNA-binding transcriptional regulator GbsR (MarR family)
VLGDRRDHFESLKDVWEMFRIVCLERKRRELDPTLHVLRGCVDELKGAGAASAYTRARLEEMLEFLGISSSLFDEVIHLPPSTLKGMAKLRGKLKTIFGVGMKA